MTMILSCATQRYVVQVSDRRVTNMLTGHCLDDDSNKAVVWCGRVAFAYTGLSEVGGVRTDQWIARTLSDAAAETLPDVFDALRDGATTAFRRMRFQSTLDAARLKRHA